jgi:hypothetical protein
MITGPNAGRPRRRDPLLAVVRLILGAAMVAALAGAAAFAVAVPLIFAWRGEVVASLVGRGAPPETIWAVAALLAFSAVMAVLGFYFFRHLFRLIGSVGEGDPFVPANAERLSAMAWISVAVHVVAIPMAMIGDWAADVTRDVHFKVDLPLAGLFLALVLFILARVFREGTRMRDDLEGTV